MTERSGQSATPPEAVNSLSALEAARARREAGQPAQAIQILREALRRDADTVDVWIELSAAFRDRARYSNAAFCLWKACQLRPDDMRLLDDLGRLLVRGGDYVRARAAFARIIAHDPSDVRAYISKSAIEHSQGLYEEARATLHAGARCRPLLALPHRNKRGLRIMKIVGVENAYFHFALPSDGQPTVKFQLGHFSTQYFWNALAYRTTECFIPGDTDEWQNDLPEYDVLVNTIGDPDVESGTLRALARHWDALGPHRAINDPRRVLLTSRDENYRRLHGIDGIQFPKTVRLSRSPDGRFDLEACLSENKIDFPIILREPGTHTARTTHFAKNLRDADTYLATTKAGQIYVIEFVDLKYRPDLYRKMRIFFIDGETFPVVHHIDHVWNVHGFNRKTVMAKNAWMMDTERKFVKDHKAFLGTDVMNALHRLRKTIGLDFFGVDFTVAPTGEILVYETNPTMRHSFDHAVSFPYLRPSLSRISAAFEAMLRARTRA